MTVSTELQDAFAYHRATQSPSRVSHRVPFGTGFAQVALYQARSDLEDGRKRYGAPEPGYLSRQDDGKAHASKPECFGLRHVGDVQAESHGGRDCWNKRSERGGWYTDPHGDVFKDGYGLCWGVVYQLPGRDGKALFVAGYEFGGCDGGPTLDLRTIYTSDPDEAGPWDRDPRDLTAAREAARQADDMARRAAEEEREYQTAWQAGRQWADLGAEIALERKSALELLRERRQAKAAGAGLPAICATIRASVASAWADICEARKKRAKLAQGDADGLIFWPSDKRLREAFNDGADEAVL